MTRLVDLKCFFARDPDVVRVRLERVLGSSPREAGAAMYVSAEGICGTVGGGQLEFLAIGRARDLLREGVRQLSLDVPLGPEIGQCCGGQVTLSLTFLDEAARNAALGDIERAERTLPQVLVFGAGHVGRALASLLQHMPVRTAVIDMRKEQLDLCDAQVEIRLSAIPEVEISTAPPGSAFVVATHDHGLDFLLASGALQRGDAAYVGLIGSATKRARFARWCRDQCDGLGIDALTCPIGAGGAPDKRPSIIAAMVTGEIMTALTAVGSERPAQDQRTVRHLRLADERP